MIKSTRVERKSYTSVPIKVYYSQPAITNYKSYWVTNNIGLYDKKFDFVSNNVTGADYEYEKIEKEIRNINGDIEIVKEGGRFTIEKAKKYEKHWKETSLEAHNENKDKSYATKTFREELY